MFQFYFNKLLSNLKLVYFLALAMTCVMNLKNASATVSSMLECEHSVKTKSEVLAMFSRSIAIACLLCRITIMYKSKSDFPNYLKKIEDYKLYYPVNIFQKRHIRFIAIAIIF